MSENYIILLIQDFSDINHHKITTRFIKYL